MNSASPPSRLHYARLVAFKVYAELREEVARHYMGIIWWVLDPLLYMTVFYIVFGVLPIRDRPEEFLAFLLVGLVFWRWFQESIMASANSLISNRAVLQLVYVPKLIFPISAMLSTVFKFCLVLLLLMAYLWISGNPPSAAYLYLPVVMTCQVCLILGVSFFAATIVPIVPDFLFAFRHGLRLMFFVSGIFFAGSQLLPEHQRIFYMNPMARLIESYRQILIDATVPDLMRLAPVAGISLVFAVIGIWLVIGMDRKFPKILVDK